MRMFLQAMERLPEPDRSRLKANMAPVYARVMDAPVLGWMPGEVNYDACDVLTETLGKDGARDYFRQLYRRVWAEAPFMSGFVQGVARMHRDPGALFKYLRPGYPQIFRHFGVWTILDRQQNRVLAELKEIPARTFEHDALWLDYVAASLETMFDLMNAEADAKVISKDRDAGTAVFEFVWR